VDLPVVIPSLSALKFWIQTPLGVSDWVTVDQQRIDRFAEATGDRQWIHVDVERARRESPWKQTIAHGYLTLSLVPELLSRLVVILGVKTAINTGVDKLRFSVPVLAGSRVRLHAEIKDAREVPGGALRVTFNVRVEVEGGAKPALIANVSYLYYPA
jgi:acyl dehydratase